MKKNGRYFIFFLNIIENEKFLIICIVWILIISGDFTMQNNLTTSKKNTLPYRQKFLGSNLIDSLFNMIDVSHNPELRYMEPKIEVSEKKNNVLVTAEIPGVDVKDIDLEISANGYLTISGEKKHENMEKSENGGYFSEISYGKVSRTISLPWDLELSKVTADYNNGILTVNLPKTNSEQNKKQKINIKSKTNKKEKKANK